MKIFSSFLFHVSDPDAVGMRPKHFDPWMERNEKEKGRRGEENDNENGKKYYYRKLKKLSSFTREFSMTIFSFITNISHRETYQIIFLYIHV